MIDSSKKEKEEKVILWASTTRLFHDREPTCFLTVVLKQKKGICGYAVNVPNCILVLYSEDLNVIGSIVKQINELHHTLYFAILSG